jgi:hypothetical protein
MTPTTGRTSKGILATIAAIVLILIPATAAHAGSGGVGPGGTGGGGTGGSGGKIEGVNPAYAKFASIVSERTDLSLRVLGAWSLAEGGPKDNPLNIGPGHHFGTVRKGAAATTDLLSQSLYRKIMASAGEPDSTQIRAIARSSWCPGCKGYERLLRSTYSSVEVIDEP